MDKKLISKITGKNLGILIFTIITTVNFMREVMDSLYTPMGMGALNINSVGYTLFQLKIDVIQGSFHHLYVIYNYPLIPISIGIIYNFYIWIKNCKKVDCEQSQIR